MGHPAAGDAARLELTAGVRQQSDLHGIVRAMSEVRTHTRGCLPTLHAWGSTYEIRASASTVATATAQCLPGNVMFMTFNILAGAICPAAPLQLTPLSHDGGFLVDWETCERDGVLWRLWECKGDIGRSGSRPLHLSRTHTNSIRLLLTRTRTMPAKSATTARAPR